jgi:DNA-binding LytR/AlgR family response regulator
MLNCVIIDDEQFSVDAILKYIDLLPELNVADVFMNPYSALKSINEESNIDLLFMDIDMPLISGIELAKTLRSKAKRLVFTTSHSMYAFEAYEAEGDAYLLKPYTFAKFAATINRLFQKEKLIQASQPRYEAEYFFVKNKEEDLRIVKVLFSDVIAFESQLNYIKIYLHNNKNIIAYLTAKDILDLTADRPEFQQFHRGFVISTDNISYIEGNIIKMSNGLSFTVGENFKNIFHDYLAKKLITTSRKKSG